MIEANVTLFDEMSVETHVHDGPGAHANLTVFQGTSTLSLTALDPDVWRRLERACRALRADHAAALNPPPERGMIP